MNSVTCNIEGVGPVSLITDGPQTVLGGNAFALNKFARGALLMGIDLVALFLASICGYLVWVRAVLDQPSDPYVALLPMIMAFPILFTVGGLYSEARMATVEMLKRSWQYTSLGFLLLASATFAMKVGYAYSRVSFAAMWLLSLVLVPLFRTLAVRFLQERRWWLEPAIYVDWRANGTADPDLGHDVNALGYRILGHMRPLLGTQRSLFPNGNRPRKPTDEVPDLSYATALVRQRDFDGERLEWLRRSFRKVVCLQDSTELPVEPVRLCKFGGVIGIEFTNELLRPHNRLIKRTVDLVFGSLFLLIASPFIFVFGLLVKIIDPGPAFFRQEREGLHGHLISICKLRTMRVDAERRLEEVLAAHPGLKKEWEQNFKLMDDPRVIPYIGNLMRRLSIDELPQLWNVVTGRMSLVGPRPFPTYHMNSFSSEHQDFRNSVRPGLTGLWQVTVRSSGDLNHQQTHDAYYIRNWSLWMDTYILAATFKAVFSVGRAA